MTKTTILAGAVAALAIAAPSSLGTALPPRDRSDVRGLNTVTFSELSNDHVTYRNHITVGTVTEWGNIMDATERAARRSVARTSVECQRLCAAAIGTVEDMGFKPAQARAVLNGAQTIANLSGGRVSAADALNASRGLVASGMRYQAQSSAARSRRLVAPAVALARSLPPRQRSRAMSAVGATPQPRRRRTRFRLASSRDQPVAPRSSRSATATSITRPTHHSSRQQQQGAIPR